MRGPFHIWTSSPKGFKLLDRGGYVRVDEVRHVTHSLAQGSFVSSRMPLKLEADNADIGLLLGSRRHGKDVVDWGDDVGWAAFWRQGEELSTFHLGGSSALLGLLACGAAWVEISRLRKSGWRTRCRFWEWWSSVMVGGQAMREAADGFWSISSWCNLYVLLSFGLGIMNEPCLVQAVSVGREELF